MNIVGKNYNIIGEFDISAIKEQVLNLTLEDWNLDVSRQSNSNPTHKMTKSYFINSLPLSWDGNGYPLERKTSNDRLYDEVKKISDFLENNFNGRVGRTLFVNLLAGGFIRPHIDNGYYLKSCHRFHIPIVTNDRVIFTLGRYEINMKPGICYEINNSDIHSVNNPSNLDRIHLIMDIIPNKAFIS